MESNTMSLTNGPTKSCLNFVVPFSNEDASRGRKNTRSPFPLTCDLYRIVFANPKVLHLYNFTDLKLFPQQLLLFFLLTNLHSP